MIVEPVWMTKRFFENNLPVGALVVHVRYDDADPMQEVTDVRAVNTHPSRSVRIILRRYEADGSTLVSERTVMIPPGDTGWVSPWPNNEHYYFSEWSASAALMTPRK